MYTSPSDDLDAITRTKEDVELLQAYTTARIRENEARKQAEIEDVDDLEVLAESPTEPVLPETPSKQASKILEVCISGLGGGLCRVVVDPRLRVRDVKLRVATVTKVPIDQQRLFLGSAELRDHDLVSDVMPPGFSLADVTMVRIDPEWQQSLEMVSIAGMQLAVVPPKWRNDQTIALAAVRQNGASLEFASEDLRADHDVVMAAVQDCGLALEFAHSDLQLDRALALAAVQQNGMALRYTGKLLRADRELVLAAVRSASKAFQFAAEELREDYEFVLSIVREAGLALEFASMDLRSNIEVVVAAVRQDGLALEYGSDELRADRSIVLEAVQQNGLALWDAAVDLKQDPEITAACKWG